MASLTDIPMFLWDHSLPYDITVVNGGRDFADFGTGKFGFYDSWTKPKLQMEPYVNPRKWETQMRQLYLFYLERLGAHKPFLFPAGYVTEVVGENAYQVGHGGVKRVIASGDGTTASFALPDKYVDPNSVVIYVDGVAQQSDELLTGTSKTMDDIGGAGDWIDDGAGFAGGVTSEFMSAEPGRVKSCLLDNKNPSNASGSGDQVRVRRNYTHTISGTQYWQFLSSVFCPSQYRGADSLGGDTYFLSLYLQNPGDTARAAYILPYTTNSDIVDFWVVQANHCVSTAPGALIMLWYSAKGYAAGGPKKVSYVSRPSLRSTNWLFSDDKLNHQTDGTEITFQAGNIPASGAIIEAEYTRMIKVRFMPGGITFGIGAGHLADPGRIVLIEEFEP